MHDDKPTYRITSKIIPGVYIVLPGFGRAYVVEKSQLRTFLYSYSYSLIEDSLSIVKEMVTIVLCTPEL